MKYETINNIKSLNTQKNIGLWSITLPSDTERRLHICVVKLLILAVDYTKPQTSLHYQLPPGH